ncbi:HNH homing endonuclease [Citrobacter phage Ci1]|nr:HNH homing endonuclease [Citrobacter phage Ci1]
MKEVFKDVVGYEEYFQISNFGRVFSKRSNKILKYSRSGLYLAISTKLNGRGKSTCLKIHRLVAEAFIPNPNNFSVVNHKDGNKHNNHVDNLEWCTQKENMIHAFDTGLKVPIVGVDMYNSKLSEQDVRDIRRLWKEGVSQVKLKNMFNVSKTTIQGVIHRKTYKNIL